MITPLHAPNTKRFSGWLQFTDSYFPLFILQVGQDIILLLRAVINKSFAEEQSPEAF